MVATLNDGWLSGSLPDDTGKEWPIKQFRQPSARGPLSVSRPNLVLHTTETDGYVENLRFPSQWQCGEGIIGQHIKLGLAGDAVNNHDLQAQQIEMVGRSQIGVWLPSERTLGPTVAITAWLHLTKHIKTGTMRPTDWPIAVDRLPAAVTTYYRRLAGLWPETPGVYGHIEIPNNSHWDPGGFNYPVLFRRVKGVFDNMNFEDWWEGWEMHAADKPKPTGLWRLRGWNARKSAVTNPKPDNHLHAELAKHPHVHGEDVGVTA